MTDAAPPDLATPAVHPLALLTPDAIDQANATARSNVRQSWTQNTADAFADDWRTWEKFLAPYGLEPCQVSIALLVAFARDMQQQGRAVTTIKRRLAGVRRMLREKCGAGLTPADADVLNAEVRRITRVAAQERTNTGRGQADPLTVRQLRTICATTPDTMTGTRDRAMLLVGFGIGARRSELAALDVEDIEVTSSGLLVHVRWSKTGGRVVAVPPGTHDVTCPVRAWTGWLARSGITAGPAFRPVRGSTVMPDRFRPAGVGAALTRRAKSAGIAGKITGHSLRAGMATEARRAGHDVVTIARQGGWSEKSTEIYRYIRVVDQWADNAMVGIGL